LAAVAAARRVVTPVEARLGGEDLGSERLEADTAFLVPFFVRGARPFPADKVPEACARVEVEEVAAEVEVEAVAEAVVRHLIGSG
jgi:hypothetical protein